MTNPLHDNADNLDAYEQELLARLKRHIGGDAPDAPLQDAGANELYHALAEAETEPNRRAKVLRTAESLVNGSRNASYGSPDADFSRTASFWQTYLAGVVERNNGKLVLSSYDVAVMMMLLKISRLAWSPDKEDSWVDTAGYAACGADCAERVFGGLA